MSAIQMLIANLRSLNDTDRAAVLESFKLEPAQQKLVTANKAVLENLAAAGIHPPALGGAALDGLFSVGESENDEAPAAGGGGAAAKPESKKKGVPTVHGDFLKKICEEQKDAIAAFKAANPDQKGAHLVFVSAYKKEHAAEFEAFKSAWEAKKPVEADPPAGVDAASVAALAAAVGDAAAEDLNLLTGQQLRDIYHAFQGKPGGLKTSSPGAASTKELLIKAILEQRAGTWQGSAARAPLSDEQKAKMKAGREAAAAKKKAEAALAAGGSSVTPSASSPKEKGD